MALSCMAGLFWAHWEKPGKLRRPVLRMKNFGIFTKNVGIEMELSLGILEYIRMVHWRKNGGAGSTSEGKAGEYLKLYEGNVFRSSVTS